MIRNTLFLLSFVVLITACQQKSTTHLNGAKLIQEKCSQCHNLDLPPKTFEDEKAPPMMAVAFHIKGFIETNDESSRIPKAIAFVKDYVFYPDAKKSFCDKKSLESYGVMPSQKGALSEEELEAIAKYLFAHFTQKNLNEAQAIKNKLAKMPQGERLALQYNCLGCHKVDKKLVGPSFQEIALRYKSNPESIAKSIALGSKGKWSNTRAAQMPSFKEHINQEDIQTLTQWIHKLAIK